MSTPSIPSTPAVQRLPAPYIHENGYYNAACFADQWFRNLAQSLSEMLTISANNLISLSPDLSPEIRQGFDSRYRELRTRLLDLSQKQTEVGNQLMKPVSPYEMQQEALLRPIAELCTRTQLLQPIPPGHIKPEQLEELARWYIATRSTLRNTPSSIACAELKKRFDELLLKYKLMLEPHAPAAPTSFFSFVKKNVIAAPNASAYIDWYAALHIPNAPAPKLTCSLFTEERTSRAQSTPASRIMQSTPCYTVPTQTFISIANQSPRTAIFPPSPNMGPVKPIEERVGQIWQDFSTIQVQLDYLENFFILSQAAFSEAKRKKIALAFQRSSLIEHQVQSIANFGMLGGAYLERVDSAMQNAIAGGKQFAIELTEEIAALQRKIDFVRGNCWALPNDEAIKELLEYKEIHRNFLKKPHYTRCSECRIPIEKLFDSYESAFEPTAKKIVTNPLNQYVQPATLSSITFTKHLMQLLGQKPLSSVTKSTFNIPAPPTF